MQANFLIQKEIVSLIAAILGGILASVLWAILWGKGKEKEAIATALTTLFVVAVFLDVINRGPLSALVTGQFGQFLSDPGLYLNGIQTMLIVAITIGALWKLLWGKAEVWQAIGSMVATVVVEILYFDIKNNGPISQALARRIANLVGGG